MVAFPLTYFCTASTRTTRGSYNAPCPSEYINGFERSALNTNSLLNIASSAVRSPSRTCVRSVTLTRAEVVALATSLNCVYLASWMQLVPPPYLGWKVLSGIGRRPKPPSESPLAHGAVEVKS